LRVLKRLTHVLPLGQALHALSEGAHLPPRAVALTFDDGYRDNLEVAVPVLERLELPATFFLVPGFLSEQVYAWWEVLAWALSSRTRDVGFWEGGPLIVDGVTDASSLVRVAERLKRQPRHSMLEALEDLTSRLAPTGSPGDLFLDWEGARELVRRGFDVGSHTMCHTVLSAESAEDQRRELTESRRQLETELCTSVTILAYPNGMVGDYAAPTFSLAQAAGYAYALTTQRGANRPLTPRYEVQRFMVDAAGGFSAIKGALRAAVSAR
jgi:peptidoglycan/xylan/chitin deacetylase (PgdA/CDA1 family)